MPALDLSGRTALQQAIAEGYVAGVALMLKTSVDAAGVTTTDGSPGASRELLRAVDWGNADAVRTLLQAGASANSVGRNHESALWLAVEDRHVENVRQLLNAGADPNVASTWDGTTPLWNAVKQSQAPIVELLLQYPGIHLRTTARDGSTPLGRARSERCYDQTGRILEMVERCELERSHPASREWIRAAIAGDVALLQQLFDTHGREYLDCIATNGCTALHRAAWHGHVDAVRQLLGWGANANQHDGDGLTALNEAVTSGHLAVVKLLIAHGADPNILKASGTTPLYDAAFNGREDIVEALLDGGADIHPGVETARPAPTVLQTAVRREHDGVAALLLRRGANPHLVGPDGLTTATWAVRFGTPEIKAIFAAHV
ncbi:ankyrin repeat domain-containing protein [Stenotrophomonas bentonitica]